MQDHYQRERIFLGPNANVQLTFVGTLFQAVCFSFMFFTNILYSFLGVRRLLVVGTLLVSGGLFLSGQATSIWHLYLSLSVCTGTGVASMQVIAARLLPNWFQKYRNTAVGIQTTVIPCGGLVYPYFMVHINKALGPSWTFRMLGLFYFVCSVSGFFIIRERKPPINAAEERKKVLHFQVLKNINFIIWMLIHPLQLYAQYIAYAFLPPNATYLGLSDVNGATLVSIMSASSFAGRICSGFFADKIGGLNMFSINMAISSISLWTVWILASNFAGLIGFSLMNGFVNGCFGTIAVSVTMTIVGSKDYPAATGLRMVTFITSVFGSLLAGYLESVNYAQPFLYCKLVAGAGAGMSCVLAIVLKLRLDKRLLAKL
ncbi:major facilitator superfamily domain-containing protein [Fennellomyces sp. T-0311]|nr:major facilitator superfamily domain-containing protein [Fennellomyces sp. T-0311]